MSLVPSAAREGFEHRAIGLHRPPGISRQFVRVMHMDGRDESRPYERLMADGWNPRAPSP